jgi:ElaB/YqjD/DUF883 family membrane-anchored ribosome-binding protein
MPDENNLPGSGNLGSQSSTTGGMGSTAGTTATGTGTGTGTGGTTEDLKAHVKQAAEDLRAAAQAKAQELRGRAEEYYDQARHRAEDYYGEARQRARTLQDDGEAYVRENPMRAVVTALGAGFVLGLLFRR